MEIINMYGGEQNNNNSSRQIIFFLVSTAAPSHPVPEALSIYFFYINGTL